MIVHNLFALEAFHIAEALGVHSLVASPCLVPYGPPVAFERRFKAAFPSIFDVLSCAEPGKATIFQYQAEVPQISPSGHHMVPEHPDIAYNNSINIDDNNNITLF